MTEQDVVADFSVRLRECVSSIHAQFAATSRIAATEPLKLLPRGGGVAVREGRLEGLGTFHLHGSGCLVELMSGEIIDFDWNADGNEIFDGWRLRRYALSRGEDFREADLVTAARADDGIVETEPGWFTLGKRCRTRKVTKRHRRQPVDARPIRLGWQS